MPKLNSHLQPKKHPTEEKLRGTPFSTAEALDKATQEIRKRMWQNLTESKVISELLSKKEFSHIKEELKAGLTCSQNDNPDKEIYKIFSEGVGLKIELNKNFTKSLGEKETRFIQGIVQGGIEGYGNLYFQIKGFIKPSIPSSSSKDLVNKETKKKTTKKK